MFFYQCSYLTSSYHCNFPFVYSFTKTHSMPITKESKVCVCERILESTSCTLGNLRRITESVFNWFTVNNPSFVQETNLELGDFFCNRHYMAHYVNLKNAKTTGMYNMKIMTGLEMCMKLSLFFCRQKDITSVGNNGKSGGIVFWRNSGTGTRSECQPEENDRRYVYPFFSKPLLSNMYLNF